MERVIAAPARQVFDVLADGWSYSDWVVGTVHISAVDDDWPRPGTSLYHKSGPWPLSLHDKSTVLRCEKPRHLELRAGLWPLGAATVTFTLTPVGTGDTRVSLDENFSSGPLRWIRTRVNDLALHVRNRESLRRLADIATHRRPRPDAPDIEDPARRRTVSRQ